MPYIAPERRVTISQGDHPKLPGELNYVITKIINTYLDDQVLYKGTNIYMDYNDVLGVLEAVKQEFYRRRVVPYEDQKIKENGDVY